MWGKLSSVAQIVTDKLEESFGDDQEQTGAVSAQPQVSPQKLSSPKIVLLELSICVLNLVFMNFYGTEPRGDHIGSKKGVGRV